MSRQDRSTALLRPLALISLALTASLALGCGGSDSDGAADSAETGYGLPAPPVSAAAAPDTANADLRQISADAQTCLDLVRAESYVAAVDPCQRAVASGASADVNEAYETAKNAVAEKGTDAAMRAVASGLEGGSMTDSLKKSASDAMGGSAAPDSASDAADAAAGMAGGFGQQ